MQGHVSVWVWQVALPVQLNLTFSYLDPQISGSDTFPVQIGCRVLVEFGRRKKVGLVVGRELSTIPLTKLKSILSVLDDQPFFSLELFALLVWLADYYKAPLGQVFDMALPPLARKPESARILHQCFEREIKHLLTNDQCADGILNDGTLSQAKSDRLEFPLLRTEQQQAIEQVIANLNHYGCFLLDGITGSGKTEVYLQVMQAALAKGKQVLLLVPEIGLTPQMLLRVQERFPGQAVLIHSQLTAKQRFIIWQAVKRGKIRILIGTRSAVFAEFADLGLIVVDEEHDASFKQQEAVRYHAKHVAIKRAHQLHIPIILGSATPSLETLYHARIGHYRWLRLQERVSSQSTHWTIVPAPDRSSSPEERQSGLNQMLVAAVLDQLEQGRQILVFINRRGYAPGLLCLACHWQATCARCDARMVLHKFPKPQLICHHCDQIQTVITSCPQCGSHQLKTVGEGTQKLEDSLLSKFAAYPVIRIDKDSTRKKNQLEARLDFIHTGAPAILVGTQMLAKGHHFPNISLVVILGVDYALAAPDFRALEKLAQQLVQVSGRAGRGAYEASAMIQTANVRHAALIQLVNSAYPEIAETILAHRQSFHFPPYGYLIRFHARAKSQQKLFSFLEQAKQQALPLAGKFSSDSSIKIIGPTEDLPSKKADYYYASLLFHGLNRKYLHQCVKHFWQLLEQQPVVSVKWYFDVDPV